MFWRKREKDLREHLKRTKKIVIDGVSFHIKKIDPFAYLEGYRVMFEMYSEYKTKNQKKFEDQIQSVKDMKKFYGEVICAGVVKPKIVMKAKDQCGEDISIDEITEDLTLMAKLGNQILAYTYGDFKKKISV